MTRAPTGPCHVLLFAYSFYGHQKPTCDLAVRIVRARRVYVTILVGDKLHGKIQQELDGHFRTEDEKPLAPFIRTIGINCGSSGFDSETTILSFADAYNELAKGRSISASHCDCTRINCDGFLQPPGLIILDILGYETLKSVRSVSGTSVRVLVLQPSMAAQIFLMSAPKDLGGRGDFAVELRMEAENVDVVDENIPEFAQQLWERRTGKIIGGVAGLPLMHDYEVYPQMSVFGKNVSIAYMARDMYRLFSECDGIILNTSLHIEYDAVSAWKSWISPRPIYILGPLAPAHDHNTPEGYVQDVETFLDDALAKYGINSVVYMSFGTVFWTTEPEKIWTVLDAFMESGIPFVFAHASPLSNVPESVSAKIAASGLGYISEWVPQRLILSHQATGWFLTHCGQNSILESLMAGIPMICWPFRGDQPCSAANLTANLNVAYELFEVRNGVHGLAPLMRLGGKTPKGDVASVYREIMETLERAKGEDGAEKRRNAERIRSELLKAWTAEGDCTVQLEELLDNVPVISNVLYCSPNESCLS